MVNADAMNAVQQVIAGGPFGADWESLQAVSRCPRGTRTPSSASSSTGASTPCPAFGNEWYPRNMYLQGSPEFEHHVATYGPQTEFGYKDFIPQFTAEKFDPDALGRPVQAGRRAVRRAGRGAPRRLSAMYDSGLSEWTAAKMGPKRDLIGDLAAAVRQQLLVFGLSSTAPSTGGSSTAAWPSTPTCRTPRYAGLYGPAQPKTMQPNEEFLDDWLLRTCELVDKYQPAAGLVRLVDRGTGLPAVPAALRRLLLQPRRRVGARRGDQLQVHGAFPRARRSSTSSAASSTTSGRCSGRPTRRCPRTPGATSQRSGLQDGGRASSATWWISSARTARCC